MENLKLIYPYSNKIEAFDIQEIPGNLLKGERRKDFWPSIYDVSWDLSDKLDVFHNTVNGIGLPVSFEGRTVITLHDLIPYVMPETVDAAHLDFTLRNTPRIIDRAAHIITVSEYSKSDIKRYFNVPDEKITVTHLAADEIYRPMDRDKAAKVIFHKYGVDKKYILYLGGFSKRKNIARLIHAFKDVLKESPSPLYLLILGEHSRSFNILWALTEQLGLCEYVRFLDFIPTEDLPYFYNAAEVFVYPSLYEGFGLPPLEAMQCGTPVVTSNVSSIPEIVGDACLTIDPYKVDAISEGILKLLQDRCLWGKFQEAGIKKAADYNWESTASKTFSVYKKCL